MIIFERTETTGWEHAIRGMRNPMNSWDKSDSKFQEEVDFDPEDHPCFFKLGESDGDIMLRLAKGGSTHAKYRRMITVYVDITAPLYWWKEFDTYKVGTVSNSCSTMHKIHEKEFTLDDFSHDQLVVDGDDLLKSIIRSLNAYRQSYLDTKDKLWWWQMIQLLPSSYNQKRTIMMNYEVLAGIYQTRKNHKLDEWREFCTWIEDLPYSRIITLKTEEAW